MTAVEAVRGRFARGALAAPAFQRAALATLVLLWLVVTTGALVRLTASGLGCPHWPTCEANALLPQDSSHALIEFSNRVISGIAMLAAVALAVAARRVPGLDPQVGRAAAVAAAGTVAQIPLGAVTVAFDLNPILVMSHFLLAMVVVAVASWVAVAAYRHAHGGPAAVAAGGRTGLLAWATATACVALVTTGAFVTAAGPHPGSTDRPIRRLGDFYWAAWMHVRVATVFAVLLLALAAAVRRRARGSAAERFVVAALVLAGCQAAVGEYQYRNGLPWEVVAVHVTLGATLLGAVVAAATLIGDGEPA